MAPSAVLSLARIDTARIEALWRRLSALPAKTRALEEHLGSSELVEVLDSLLGQPAWLLVTLLEAVLAERGNFAPAAPPPRPAGPASPLVEYRMERQHGTTSPELVWSGDTGRRSCARKTRYVIEDLFAAATSRVLIAGYSFDSASDLFDPLFDRAEQLAAEGLPPPKVRVVLDCSQLKVKPREGPDDLARRASTEFMKVCWTRETLAAEILYYKPSVERRGTFAPYSMHAKCIVVDGGVALVGSANFSNRGRDRNLEVGTLIRDHHFVQALLAAWDDITDELATIPEPPEHPP